MKDYISLSTREFYPIKMQQLRKWLKARKNN